jgi:hypothetical protein
MSADINMWNHNAGLWASLEDQRNTDVGIASVDVNAPGDLYQAYGESYQYNPTTGTYQSINTGNTIGHPGNTPVEDISSPYDNVPDVPDVPDTVDSSPSSVYNFTDLGGGEGHSSSTGSGFAFGDVIGPNNPQGSMLTSPSFSINDAITGFSVAGIPGLAYGYTSGVPSNNAPGAPGATGVNNPSDGVGNPGDNATPYGGLSSLTGGLSSPSTATAHAIDMSNAPAPVAMNEGSSGSSGAQSGAQTGGTGATAGGDVGDGTRGGPSGGGSGGSAGNDGGPAADGGGW